MKVIYLIACTSRKQPGLMAAEHKYMASPWFRAARGLAERQGAEWFIQFWALGQANFKVVNGLGAMGLLNRVWTDGSWWILDAACERFAVIQDGRIVMHSLEGIARSFFTITECMAANLRSLLGAYAGLWEWPPPDPLPTDPNDPDQVEDMKGRLQANQLELFGPGRVKVMAGCAVITDDAG